MKKVPFSYLLQQVKKSASLIVILFILNSCQLYEESTPTAEDSFIKFYGSSEALVAKELIEDDEGNIVVLGTANNSYYVLKTDEKGIFLTSLTFSPNITATQLSATTNEPERLLLLENQPKSIKPTNDGYIVAGYSSITDPALGLVSYQVMSWAFLDKDLNLLDTVFWKRAEQNDVLVSDVDNNLTASDVVVLSDNSFMILGSKQLIDGNGEQTIDFYYAVMDREGNFDYEKNEGQPGMELSDRLVRGFQKSNGNVAMIGYSKEVGSQGETGFNVKYLEVIPIGGAINNGPSYGITGSNSDAEEVVNDVFETNSGYVVTGTTTLDNDSSYAFFVNISSEGTLLSDVKIIRSTQGKNLAGNGITSDGKTGYVIVGQVIDRSNEEDNNLIYISVDAFGNTHPSYETVFGGPNTFDEGVKAITLSSGRLVICGTLDFGTGVTIITLIKSQTGPLL